MTEDRLALEKLAAQRDRDHRRLRNAGMGHLVDMADRVARDLRVSVHLSEDEPGKVNARADAVVGGIRISHRSLLLTDPEFIEAEIRRLATYCADDVSRREAEIRLRKSRRGRGGVL